MKHIVKKHLARLSRHSRIRASVTGNATRPRLAVHRSLKFMSAQIIDDLTGKTLVAAHERELKSKTGTKTDRARAVGQLLATKAKAAKITAVVFDRGGFTYHGRVQALADGAREEGLKI